jgi:transcriptional regulator with XRE-family HTH domain
MSGQLTVQQAARELRAHCQKSQQAMATFLGMSIAALRNYESGAVTEPDPRQACVYMMAADGFDRPDLAEVFRSVLRRSIGVQEQKPKNLAEFMKGPFETASTLFMGSMNSFEERLVAVLLGCVRGQGPYKKYQESVFEALWRPFGIPLSDEDLRLLKRETLEDELAVFKKAGDRKPRKGKVSA